MHKLKNILSLIALVLYFSAISPETFAKYCLPPDAGSLLTSSGKASINNKTTVTIAGRSGSSTGNVSTCGDGWNGTPTCPGGGYPKGTPQSSADCNQLQNNAKCDAYFRSGTGTPEVKKECDALKSKCQSAKGECINPAPIEGNPKVISMFERSNGDLHGGMDFGAPRGVPVFAPMDGVYKTNGTGSIHIYSSSTDITAEYHHLFCYVAELKNGTTVAKGDLVGFSGNTGNSAGPHLHLSFFQGKSKPSSRGGYINAVANQTNSAFCPMPTNACVDGNNTKLSASGTKEQSLCLCGTNNCGTGENNYVGGGGIAGNTTQTGSATLENNKKCHPSKFMGMFSTCLFCDLFKTVYNAASSIAKLSFNVFAGPIANVLVVALAIWLAIKVLPIVSSFKAQAAPGFLREIIEKCFLALIVLLFLKSDGLGFFTYLMEPIFNTGFNLAKTLLNTQTPCQNEYGILTYEQGAGLPASMGNSVVCIIEQLQTKIKTVLAMGTTSLCIAFFMEATFNIPILPNISYLITGIMLWLGGLVLLMVFPFLVLDSVLQLTVAVGLLPFGMAAFVFKATKKYATNVWNTFMATVFNFVFLCLVVTVIIETIDSILGDTIMVSLETSLNNNLIDGLLDVIGWESVLFLKIFFVLILAWTMLEETSSFASEFSGGGFKLNMARQAGGLMMATATNAGKRVLSPLKQGAKNALKRTKASYGRMRLQQRANTQRAKFEKGKKDENGVVNLGNGISLKKDENGNIVRIETSKGKTVTKVYGFDAQGRSTRSVETQQNTSLDRKAQKRLERAKAKGTLKENEDGSKTYTYSNKLGRQFSVIEKPDGSISYSYVNLSGKERTKTSGTNKQGSTKVFMSHDQKITQTIDKNGNLVGERTDTIGVKSQNMLDSDGDLNSQAIEKIRSNQTVLEQRLAETKNADEIARLGIAIKDEREKADKIIAQAVLRERMNSDHFGNDRSFIKQTVAPPVVDEDGNTIIRITEEKADGTKDVYGVTLFANGKVLSSHESVLKDGSSITHQSDGVIQKKTLKDKDGNAKSIFAIADKSDLEYASGKDAKLNVIEKQFEHSVFSKEEKNRALAQAEKALEDGKTLLNIRAFAPTKED